MRKQISLLLFLMPILGIAMEQAQRMHDLIDFTRPIEQYSLISDATERAAGQSHGAFAFQNGINEKKAYFFAHLNPQPNGAAFVSVDFPLSLRLERGQSLCLVAKGLQNSPTRFQLTIKNKASMAGHFTYMHAFTIGEDKKTLRFKLDDFEASYRGRRLPDAPALDPSTIAAMGIRVTGRNGPSQKTLQAGLYGLALYQLSVC